MAVRWQSPLCLICQCRQSSIGRRRLLSTCRRLLQTDNATLEHNHQSFSYHNHDLARTDGDAAALLEKHSNTADSPNASGSDGYSRDDLLSFEGLSKLKDLRQRILATLRNPWPSPPPHTRPHLASKQKFDLLQELQLPEANAALIPHATFRDLILHSGLDGKPLRRIIRAQFLRAQRPRDIYRILAVCLSSKAGRKGLSMSSESIARALYRCRVNVSDPEVLAVIGVIMARFSMAGIPQANMYLSLGLRFAARSRSLKAMKKYLRLFRQTGHPMNVHSFRSVIAKFSIGKRGLGEIRNGRWKREELLQVLKGFDDCKHLPPQQQYHLGTFLDRNDWQFLHGWIAVLARCRDADAVWHEWELWKQSPGRVQPRRLSDCDDTVTTKFRGDYWFLDHMLYTGDYEKAWKIFEESDVTFRTIRKTVKFRLLERPELASQESWDCGMREAMLEKYDHELLKIEKELGVRWTVDQRDGEVGEGIHVLAQDQWETLEKLGEDEWRLETDFGFPYETKEGDVLLVPDRKEKELHKAEERGLVVFDRKPS